MHAGEPVTLTGECNGWLQLAGYSWAPGSGGELELRSGHLGSRYEIRRRASGAIEVLEHVAGDIHDETELVVHAANLGVVERFLIGLVGDEIRDDLDLPFLPLPFERSCLADGFELSGMARGFRTLTLVGVGPVAAARDEALSLAKLVPLSRFLPLSLAALKQAFLHSDGYPLLDANGRYR